jgi:hypothetical protein
MKALLKRRDELRHRLAVDSDPRLSAVNRNLEAGVARRFHERTNH